MPRVSDSGSAGFQLPGIYRALRARERRLCGWPEADVRWANPGDHSQGCFVRPRKLLEALETGNPVVLRKAQVELVRGEAEGVRFRFPWDRSVQKVNVSRDDVVTPADPRITSVQRGNP